MPTATAKKPALTIAGRAVAFKAVPMFGDDPTGKEDHDYNLLLAREDRAILNRFPDLKGLPEAEMTAHADYPEYNEMWRWRRNQLLFIREAWAGEGEPPTLEEWLSLRRSERIAILRELKRHNPGLTHLPDPEPEKKKKDGDGQEAQGNA